MKKQTLTISFKYGSKLIQPLDVLVAEIRTALMDAGQVKNAPDINDMISLDYKTVSIAISCLSCDESYKIIQPILRASDIQVIANIKLKYEAGKFIDVLFPLGSEHKEMDKETIKISADFLAEHLPEKHGFLLVAYSKNGKNLEILTENGTPEPEELMEIYGVMVQNMMP